MTDINEVMERLDSVIFQPEPEDQEERGVWCFDLSRLCDDDAVKLKALLSYTKQCREALEPFAKAGELFKWKPPGSGATVAIYTPAAGSEYAINSDHLRLARQALSTQSGERE